MLRTLFIQTIFAVHAIALTAAILIVVKPTPAIPTLQSITPTLIGLISTDQTHLTALTPADHKQLSHAAP
jgi:hypothetical protein